MGEPPSFDFEPRDHLDLGVELDVIDMESAGPASGSRFAYLKRELVLVELALVQFAIQKLASRRIYAGRSARAGARGRVVLDGLPSD